MKQKICEPSLTFPKYPFLFVVVGSPVDVGDAGVGEGDELAPSAKNEASKKNVSTVWLPIDSQKVGPSLLKA